MEKVLAQIESLVYYRITGTEPEEKDHARRLNFQAPRNDLQRR